MAVALKTELKLNGSLASSSFALAAGTTTGLSGLTINGTDWLDGAGNSLLDIRPDATFALEQVGSDIYLTFVAVPEPSAYVLGGIGSAIAAFLARRRLVPPSLGR